MSAAPQAPFEIPSLTPRAEQGAPRTPDPSVSRDATLPAVAGLVAHHSPPSALSAAIHNLHQVAVETLTRLLQTETNPQELRRLLAVALRFKDPQSPASPAPSRKDADFAPASPFPKGRGCRVGATGEGSSSASSAPHTRAPGASTGTVRSTTPQPTTNILAAAGLEGSRSDPDRKGAVGAPPDTCIDSPAPAPVLSPLLATVEGSSPLESELTSQVSKLTSLPPTPALPSPLTSHVSELTSLSPPPPTLQSALGIGSYTAMSDAEFLLLSREIGYTEAHRRRLIRATLARERAESQARANAADDTDDADADSS